jgi:hypothetical protein
MSCASSVGTNAPEVVSTTKIAVFEGISEIPDTLDDHRCRFPDFGPSNLRYPSLLHGSSKTRAISFEATS